jgi:hypothetical protein
MRRLPRSGQVVIVGLPVAGAERPLGAGEEDADRSDREVEGGGDLGVAVAAVAQQQAGALAFWQSRERRADLVLLLAAEDRDQRSRALGAPGLEPAGAVQPLACSAAAADPVEAVVDADPARQAATSGSGRSSTGAPAALASVSWAASSASARSPSTRHASPNSSG